MDGLGVCVSELGVWVGCVSELVECMGELSMDGWIECVGGLSVWRG